MNKQFGFLDVEIVGALVAVAIALLGFGGWVANIVKLAGMDFGAITGMLVIRAIGIIVAPLGAVMGFL